MISMLNLLFTSPSSFFIILLGIVLAISVHEAAHCYVADYLGDPTPRSLGRVTLNPLAHLDPIGTLMIILTGAFGWGKSSPFDPYNLRNPQRDTALIGLAGPAANIILAAIFALIFHLIGTTFVSGILTFLVGLNVNLALFNLLPVPPLDGSKIFLKTNPFRNQNSYLLLLLLILPIFSGNSIASFIISPISSAILHLLIG
jgi:Zn-dependent protease